MEDRGYTPEGPGPTPCTKQTTIRNQTRSTRMSRKRHRSSTSDSSSSSSSKSDRYFKNRKRHRRRSVRHRRGRSYSRRSQSSRRSRIDSPPPRRRRSHSVSSRSDERNNVRSYHFRSRHISHRSRVNSPSPQRHMKSRYRVRRRHNRDRSRSRVSGESSDKRLETHSPSSRIENSSENILNQLISALQGRTNVRSNYSTHVQGSQNVITEFDPTSKSQTINDWLAKINESAEIYGWTEQQTIFYALPKLSGLAKKWYDGLTTVKFTWNEWQQKLLTTFPSDQNYADLLVEMLNRKSRRNETLVEYFYDKIMLINRCQLKGRQAVDCLSHGVYDNNTRINIQGAQFNDPDQVLNYFRNISHNIRERNYIDNSRKNPETQENKFKGSNDFSTNRKIPQTITCYNCREVGHTVANCTKEILKCNKCKRHGHLESNCRAHW